MTKFTKGPADGQVLALKNSPHFLRVAESQSKFDALDGSEDSVRANEDVYLYRQTKFYGRCHVKFSRRSGFYAIAEYEYVEEQPKEEIMRDNNAWQKWLTEQGE